MNYLKSYCNKVYPFKSGNKMWCLQLLTAYSICILLCFIISLILNGILEEKYEEKGIYDDLGSTMIEENVVAAAGVSFRLPESELVRIIEGAGFRPARRTMDYALL